MNKILRRQFIGICDVEAGWREAGKKLVDEHYGDMIMYNKGDIRKEKRSSVQCK